MSYSRIPMAAVVAATYEMVVPGYPQLPTRLRPGRTGVSWGFLQPLCVGKALSVCFVLHSCIAFLKYWGSV